MITSALKRSFSAKMSAVVLIVINDSSWGLFLDVENFFTFSRHGTGLAAKQFRGNSFLMILLVFDGIWCICYADGHGHHQIDSSVQGGDGGSVRQAWPPSIFRNYGRFRWRVPVLGHRRKRLMDVVSIFAEPPECTPDKFKDFHELPGGCGLRHRGRRVTGSMRRRLPTSEVRLAGEDLSLLHSTPGAFTYCLMCDGYFISHGVIHFSVPESTRQNVSAQEAAEEVDVDELKRIAKEAAEKAR